MLSQTVAIFDIEDAEGFVRSQLPKVILTVDMREELVVEGLRILSEMANRYEPGKGGADPEESRFSGYAAKYLQGKVRDAWHRLEGHTLITLPDGKRKWQPSPSSSSLDRLAEQRIDGTDSIRSLQHEDVYDTDFADRLGKALDEQWKQDRDLTIKVGVLLSNELRPGPIAQCLKVRVDQVMVAIDRLTRAAPLLTTLEAA